jgi:hypothetical protein
VVVLDVMLPGQNGLDLRTVPTIAGIPRFLFGTALRDAIRWCGALCRADKGAASRSKRSCGISRARCVSGSVSATTPRAAASARLKVEARTVS